MNIYFFVFFLAKLKIEPSEQSLWNCIWTYRVWRKYTYANKLWSVWTYVNSFGCFGWRFLDLTTYTDQSLLLVDVAFRARDLLPVESHIMVLVLNVSQSHLYRLLYHPSPSGYFVSSLCKSASVSFSFSVLFQLIASLYFIFTLSAAWSLSTGQWALI